ncbi:hypothetical protein AVEN_208105-1 [Araneus ventricosus]|uniref:EGF-like domain-containing protein n=1 Tax=Araneus ventricosus TaxID=182803 RepID=A0A4Y2FZE5_ARAVE|nr:hypothetical protein AVEN_208105-1 [Araneus ventricosus]
MIHKDRDNPKQLMHIPDNAGHFFDPGQKKSKFRTILTDPGRLIILSVYDWRGCGGLVIHAQYKPNYPSPILQREIFVLNLEDGFFGCQVNESVDILQLFELSKLCDGVPQCFLGSDEVANELKCTDRNFCHPKMPRCINGVCLDNLCYCNDGFGGKGCEMPDENECKYRPCDVFAHCTNTMGSFYCSCFPGYEGDGFECHGSSRMSTSKQLQMHLQKQVLMMLQCLLHLSPTWSCSLELKQNKTIWLIPTGVSLGVLPGGCINICSKRDQTTLLSFSRAYQGAQAHGPDIALLIFGDHHQQQVDESSIHDKGESWDLPLVKGPLEHLR